MMKDVKFDVKVIKYIIAMHTIVYEILRSIYDLATKQPWS